MQQFVDLTIPFDLKTAIFNKIYLETSETNTIGHYFMLFFVILAIDKRFYEY